LAAQQAEEKLRREVGRLRPRRVTKEVERTAESVKVRLLWEVEQEIQTSRPIREGDPPPVGLPPAEEATRGSEKRE
ncbi:MAG TPA: hypothetical protein GXX28_06250, partial [Firmicutes bacterium]|nr:hypothetical protein [Bacillota bacterium]